MKLNHALLVALLVSLAAFTVHADGVPPDARIIVGGGDPGGPDPCGNKLKFNIPLNGKGGGITNCTNMTGQDWIGLDITASVSQGDPFLSDSSLCDAFHQIFSTCTHQIKKTFDGKVEIEIMLSGGEGIASSGPESVFFIDLNSILGSMDPNGQGGWSLLDGGKPLEVVAVTTPEPGTLLLLLCGFGGIWLRRRRQSSPVTNV